MSKPSKTRRTMRAMDDRLGTGHLLRNQLNKIFPDHWSFMLGEIALYTFAILIVTGTFLTFFFHASEHDIRYHGSYLPLQHVRMSEAYESVIHITFDIRAGLLIRQIHHWAALLFVAAIVLHMCRIFFTGAFRKPREMNWIIGVTLAILAIVEGFAGYSLPDDLLSGTGVRIAYSILESIPWVGPYLATFIFNGQYPGAEAFIPRLYILHVLLIPGLMLVLITAHLMAVWHQKHTQFPKEGYQERNVVGSHIWPNYTMKSQGLFFMIFGVLALLAAYAQINPIWLYGPYDPAVVSAGSQPDWYMFWLEGSLRLMPHLESRFLGHTIPWNVFVPAVVLPVLLFVMIYAHPFVERLLTRDHEPHELLQRPRYHPFRTGVGIAVLVFYVVLSVAGANDVIPFTFGLDMMDFTWAMRVLLIIAPPLSFLATHKICTRLQAAAERAELAPPPDAVLTMVADSHYAVVPHQERVAAPSAPPGGSDSPEG
ncbi:MAG TPA: cytochrome bc complex cytochrome b subunit [Mycobacteriales bacterium]|nr:cytochrome bc complex cytochrome b subunit [Mycobacteriales bacterium]